MGVRQRIARWLRPFVERHDPITLPSTASAVNLPVESHYLVKRILPDGRTFALYHDVAADEAVRRWQGVIARQEQGRMEFWHNGVRRDVYEG